MKIQIPASLAEKFARQMLVAQKNAPQILFGAGIAGAIGSTVLACKATLELEDIIEEAQENLDKVHVGLEERAGYTEEAHARDVVRIYTKTLLRLGRVYAPSIIVGGLAIAALTKSHNIQAERIAGLTAALNVVQKAFDKYRSRVVEELGEEKDREFRYGKETRQHEITNPETGRKKKAELSHFQDGHSMYARLFGPQNRNFCVEPGYNVAFLRHVQNRLNNILTSRGHVFLNDAYDELGMERSKAGAIVGWLKDEGDSSIDFGIWDDANMDRFHAFVVGDEEEILIDFNVIGEMWSRI